MVKKINVTFDDEFLESIDAMAKQSGMSRSAFLAMAVNTYANQMASMQMLRDLPELLQQIEELNDKVDDSKA
ncbi:ribbon-helix-helix protein, CopG family [Enterococcus sp. AZ012]|uniref:ribbon-helix-helix protein, CopG family n=1 Tax=Enterococcus sp. AZ012 TaxID=2774682 RepID=UPI003D2D7056